MRRGRRLAVAILATVSVGFGTGTYPAQADYAETARVAWQVLDGNEDGCIWSATADLPIK